MEMVERPEILAQQIKEFASNPAVVEQVMRRLIACVGAVYLFGIGSGVSPSVFAGVTRATWTQLTTNTKLVGCFRRVVSKGAFLLMEAFPYAFFAPLRR